MEHRAEKFIELSENLIDTYGDALCQALEGRNFVTDTEIKRIYSIVKLYMPKLRPVFESVCETCPSLMLAARAEHAFENSRGIDLSSQVDEVFDFLTFLIHQNDTLRNRIFLMSVADCSSLYCTLTPNGRSYADDRLRKGLARLIRPPERMLYIGSGVFLFIFEKAADSQTITRKQAILEMVFSLVGEKAGTASGSAPHGGTAATLDSAFHAEFDVDEHMRRTISTLTAGHPADARSGGSSGRADFRAICQQLTFHYAPVWDARTCMVAIYRQEAMREIEPGVFLRGRDVLTRKRNDEFHYQYQIHKLNHAFSALLEMEGLAGAVGRLPSLLIPFSLDQFDTMEPERLESDIYDTFGHHESDRLILCLEDINERMPRNLFIKMVGILKKRMPRIFCKVPLTHEYLGILSRIDGMTVCLDVTDVLNFGFETTMIDAMIQEFSRCAKARRLSALISHVDTSVVSGIAYKAGYAFISGKVVGETRPMIGQVAELPASRILMKS